MTPTSGGVPLDSPIALAALAALEQKRLAVEEAAAASRQLLIDGAMATLDGLGLDVTTLDVAQVQADRELVIVTDGNLQLAVAWDGQVSLVKDQNGWTRVAGPFSDLAELGAALETP